MEKQKNDVVLQQFYGEELESRLLCTFNSGRAQGANTGATARITERRAKPAMSLRKFFISVFLPQGYPYSVSDDYFAYQVWDTVQAFASSLSGALATHAILKGFGVGDDTASAVGATLTWLTKDGLGMISRITFTWLKGTSLDCNCKRWRLFADIMNDAAISIEIVAGTFGPLAFRYLACIASVFRSLVGVAGGATRAALTQHQARRNNLADVAAKDGSQETLVNLTALLCNLVLVPLVTRSSLLIAVMYILCTALHLFANYRAVRSVRMRFFNVDRLFIALHSFLTKSHRVASIDAVNLREPVVFATDWRCSINLGVPLVTLPHLAGILTHSQQSQSDKRFYVDIVRHKRAIWRLRFLQSYTVRIALHRRASNIDQLEALVQAYLLKLLVTNRTVFDSVRRHFGDAKLTERTSAHSDPLSDELAALEQCRVLSHAIAPEFVASAERLGWSLDFVAFGADEWRFACPTSDSTAPQTSELPAHAKLV